MYHIYMTVRKGGKVSLWSKVIFKKVYLTGPYYAFVDLIHVNQSCVI